MHAVVREKLYKVCCHQCMSWICSTEEHRASRWHKYWTGWAQGCSLAALHFELEVCLRVRLLHNLLHKLLENQLRATEDRPISYSSNKKMSRLRLPQALLIPNRTTAVTFCLSIAPKMMSVVSMRDVSVVWNRLFPHCSVESGCFDSKNAINWFKATFSHTLEKVGSSETGLLLLGFSWSPSFGIGVTSAIFQRKRNVPVTKDALIIDVSVGRIKEGCL